MHISEFVFYEPVVSVLSARHLITHTFRFPCSTGFRAFNRTVVYLLPSRWPTTITCPNLYSAFSHHWLRKGFDLLRLHARLSAVDLIIRIINCPLKHFTPVRWGFVLFRFEFSLSYGFYVTNDLINVSG